MTKKFAGSLCLCKYNFYLRNIWMLLFLCFKLWSKPFFLTVDLKECLQSADFISSSDGNFKILEDGSVYTTSALSFSSEKKTFTVLLKDSQEQLQKKIHVSLVEEEKKVSF